MEMSSINSAMENMPNSTVLQQSMVDMQQLQSQQSFYSDPSSETQIKDLPNRSIFIIDASTVHNRSIISRPLVNTSLFSPSHTTVAVQPNVSMAHNSILNGGVCKADLPYRSSAQFGVLSK
jgi:hypothetical protein